MSWRIAMASTDRELGKYTLVAELARGGMGVVYLAHAQGPGGFQKLVVLKQLKTELAEDPKFREMFLEEANLAARLNHRNIVQTNEVSHEGDRYFMAMDYLEGCSLHTAHRRLKGDKKLTVTMELRILAEILAGLHYAHELNDYDGTPLGVVHRDVGPQNVYVTFDGQVKLLDFGVAKVLNRQQETQAGVLKGRVVYMAPEQIAGGGVDRRADIFAAGVMLRELVTGQRLWDGLSEIDTIKQLINRAIPPFPGDVHAPPELQVICEKAMAPDRENRFRTAHEMRVAIDKYVSRVDPAGSVADAGNHLAQAMVEDRKRLKEIVDARLVAGITGALPSIDFPSTRDLAASASGVSDSSSSLRMLKTPASGTLASGTASGVSEEIDGDAAARSRAGRPKEGRRSVVGAGVGIAVVAVIAVVFVARRGGGVRPETSTAGGVAQASAESLLAPLAAAPIAPPVMAPAMDTVEINVRVTPASAQIFIDDAPVDGNPFRGRFPRNPSAMHTVRAAASGFTTKSEIVKFDANGNVMLALERHAGLAVGNAAAPRPPEPRPAAPPPLATTVGTAARTTDIDPRGGKAPKRDIDQKNPYGAE